jgi:hypothetical protein
MFGKFINFAYKIIDTPALYDRIIFTTTTTGCILGSTLAATDKSATTGKDIMTNGLLGGVCGAGTGALIGFLSPVLAPVCLISGVVGGSVYGFDTLRKITK